MHRSAPQHFVEHPQKGNANGANDGFDEGTDKALEECAHRSALLFGWSAAIDPAATIAQDAPVHIRAKVFARHRAAGSHFDGGAMFGRDVSAAAPHDWRARGNVDRQR